MWGGAWDLEGGFPAGVVGVHFGYSLLDGAWWMWWLARTFVVHYLERM